MSFRNSLLYVTLLLWSVIPFAEAQQTVSPDPGTQACNVTAPNNIAAGPEDPGGTGYGNSQLSVGPAGLWPDGTVVFRPGGSGFVTPDGSLGMKFGWQHAIPGELTITGRRLDGPAAPLSASVSSGLSEPGFVPTYLIFPTPGCWEVTGKVGDVTLTFVTKVVKIGEGPTWRRDAE